MRIAFDLDDTLLCSRYRFPTELPTRSFFARVISYEQLREGTKELFEFCKTQGWQTWIYTTSYRTPSYIRRIFWLYGIRLDGVINQSIHERKVSVRSSKYPPTFGIDILIDDSKGVEIEGQKYSFKVCCIKVGEEKWIEKIKRFLVENQYN
ncbi:HAD family hydrolase [Cytophagaceae bacterium DM2B3-1]|uniref:HAD family hydrolase n=1 Tax=Xanthocytophaga flava TaxID=3048013 RepID=A0ABT7CT05_9BACT|nr:HAD family hydrolase [Xanthocytophaga flavus]MDJ1471966.1 HAD family hydrolase [Xanthocytophaga flavus]MDJ1496903.1 HAD family hydrolase [Xanthocytophaga flavus]